MANRITSPPPGQPKSSANGRLALERQGSNATDLANADRMATQHSSRLRYCWPWRKWLYWDGKRWRQDDAGVVYALAKETVRNIYKETAQQPDEESRKALAKHAVKSEDRQKIVAMIDLARSEQGVPIPPDQFDRDPWLLNCPNGTLDLTTGKFRKHDPGNYITKLCPVRFDPTAKCPLWKQVLYRIFAGDEQLSGFLQRWFGYCLTGDVSEQKLCIFWGSGANGKTTVINTQSDLLGQDYAMKAPHNFLMVRRNEQHPTDMADLFAKRFITAAETGENCRLDEALVKELTGGDRIRARRMREDFWQFEPSHKLILATNHKPTVRGTDHAIWRRIQLVPFTVKIPESEQDKRLSEKLRKELPGILNWCVQGCLEWRRQGLNEPQAVRIASDQYRREQDVLGAFIEDTCVVVRHAKVRASSLWEAYRKWCEQSREHEIKRRDFGQRLTDQGFERFTSNGTCYRGLGLKADK